MLQSLKLPKQMVDHAVLIIETEIEIVLLRLQLGVVNCSESIILASFLSLERFIELVA